MNENWERIQSLFLEALDLCPEERAGFLDTACADDAEVRREVESLIAHDGAGEHRIAEALQDTAESLFESEELSGTRLGAWRVLREIGRGGMGTVYLACRDDDQFRKHVAIKVVTCGMDTAELLNRFRHERQILAHLDHPYIARLIDGGNTSQGRPFLVMEYVQGRPIDVYCRQDGLDVGARCRLFLKVCTAVSYAHRNLVIHRDLKPGNILVAADGSPKLLDFGVAKLLDTEVDPGFAHTMAAGRLITPEYASPEQVRGELVGTASDIYALGAILYELLAGAKAQHVDSHSPAEMERIICNTEVRPPSARIEPGNARLRKQLSGDLDNIVLMAMRKDPEQRYSSVDLFAKDIGRHLKGRTVTARPPSVTYRFGKFARRNRISLVAASLVLVSLVVGTWAALLQAHRARIEQRRAEARLSQMVELANRTLFDVHGSIERLPGATDARRQLVKVTLDYLEKLSQDAGSDERLRKSLGAAYYRLGDLQGYPFAPNLGDTAGAMKSFRTGSALLDPLRRAHPDDAEAQRVWLETQDHLATLLDQTGDSEGASKLLNDALPAAAALARLRDAGADGEQIQGDLYSLQAELAAKHDSTQALAYARHALETFSGLAARYPDRADFVLEQSDGYSLVGRILHQQGDSRGTLEQFLRCVELRDALVKAHPNDVVYKRDLMIGYGHVGDILGSPIAYNLGDSAGARAYYRKAVVIGEEIHNADPNDSTAKFDLAAGLERLGMVDVPKSEMAESLAELQRSATILESMVADDPNNLHRKGMLALVHEYAGHRLQSLGRYREAITDYRRSVALSDTALAADPADRPALSQAVASSRGMATAMAMAGDRSGALRQAEATIARAEAGVKAGPDPRVRQRYVAESTIELGSIYEIFAKRSPASQQKQDWEGARSAFRRAVSVLDAMAAGGKLMRMDEADLQKARNLLAEAGRHLSAVRTERP
jgi:serine/threonine protein kinase/tetratricopeptide (TPR) repeat protein